MLVAHALTVTVLALCQAPPQGEGKPQGKKTPKAEPKSAVLVKSWSDTEAKDAVKAFKKAMKGKKALGQRLQAVNALCKGQNKLLVKPLVKVLHTDRALSVRKTAAAGLANQPSKQARPAILSLITGSRKKQGPEVTSALIKALSKADYNTRDWKHIKGLFNREFNEKYALVQKSILELVIAHKEKQAWRLLLEHIDEPAPVFVDDPSNPPASYWEARWKAWRVWRSDVKEAMFVLTGQRFSSAKEARVWAKTNGRKAGLK